jgi:hypothetical protein
MTLMAGSANFTRWSLEVDRRGNTPASDIFVRVSNGLVMVYTPELW